MLYNWFHLLMELIATFLCLHCFALFCSGFFGWGCECVWVWVCVCVLYLLYWLRTVAAIELLTKAKVLVGNKADLERDRTVPTEKGQALADEFGIPFFETSAKSGENIEEAFSALIRNMKSNPPSSWTTPNSKHNKSHRSSTCTLLWAGYQLILDVECFVQCLEDYF